MDAYVQHEYVQQNRQAPCAFDVMSLSEDQLECQSHVLFKCGESTRDCENVQRSRLTSAVARARAHLKALWCSQLTASAQTEHYTGVVSSGLEVWSSALVDTARALP